MTKITLLAGVALLGGCTSYAQRVTNTCMNLGFEPGTPDYAGCVHDQIVTDQQDRAMWSGVAGPALGLMARPPVIYSPYR
jgi:hypothetical protein